MTRGRALGPLSRSERPSGSFGVLLTPVVELWCNGSIIVTVGSGRFGAPNAADRKDAM